MGAPVRLSSTDLQHPRADTGELDSEILELEAERLDHRSPEALALTHKWNVASVFDEIAHSAKRFFDIPNNATGNTFVNELSSLLQAYVDSGGTKMDVLYSLPCCQCSCCKNP